VSELGGLLELLHGAEEPFESVVVRWRVWRHNERAHQAFIAHAERAGNRSVTMYGSGDAPEGSTQTFRIWREGERVREEHDDGRFGVAVGSIWWQWDERSGAFSNESEPEVGSGVGQQLAVLLSPARLLGAIRLRVTGHGEVVGRPTIEAEAILRPELRNVPSGFEMHDLGPGAERYVFQVDRERGVLLASTAMLGSEPFVAIEALAIAFDQPIDPERFVFVPPAGETVHNSRDLGVRLQHVTLVEAQQRAALTVLMPREVPEDWRPRCLYVEEHQRPEVPETVTLVYHSDNGHQSVNISQTVAGDERREGQSLIEADDWEVRVDGVRVRAMGGQAQAWVEREGTMAFLSSDTLSSDELARLTESLVPAPDESGI
jgi:hypothetical protein